VGTEALRTPGPRKASLTSPHRAQMRFPILLLGKAPALASRRYSSGGAETVRWSMIESSESTGTRCFRSWGALVSPTSRPSILLSRSRTARSSWSTATVGASSAGGARRSRTAAVACTPSVRWGSSLREPGLSDGPRCSFLGVLDTRTSTSQPGGSRCEVDRRAAREQRCGTGGIARSVSGQMDSSITGSIKFEDSDRSQ